MARREGDGRDGHPRTGQPARRILKVRLDDDEWVRLHALAKAAGCKSVSDYVRQRCL